MSTVEDQVYELSSAKVLESINITIAVANRKVELETTVLEMIEWLLQLAAGCDYPHGGGYRQANYATDGILKLAAELPPAHLGYFLKICANISQFLQSNGNTARKLTELLKKTIARREANQDAWLELRTWMLGKSGVRL